MEIVWSEKIDNILKIGHQLTDIGLKNWALTKLQVLSVIEQFLESGIPILGGDVCESIEGIIRPNYDSWHCDQLPDETKNNFLQRSLKKTKDYVILYPEKETQEIFFALVPDV